MALPRGTRAAPAGHPAHVPGFALCRQRAFHAAKAFHATGCSRWREKCAYSDQADCGAFIRRKALCGTSRSVRADERCAGYRDDPGWAASAGTRGWGARRWGDRGSDGDCQDPGLSVPDNVKPCRCAKMRVLAQAGGLSGPILQIRESLSLSSRMSRFHHPRRTCWF